MAIGNYTDDQVTQFVQQNANNPSAIASQASSMGLNEQQLQDALKLGGLNYTTNDITGTANSLGYNFGGAGGAMQSIPNANSGQFPMASGLQNPTGGSAPTQSAINPNVAGGTAQGGSNGMSNGILKTAGGQQVTHQQLADFAASNPNDQAILQQAAKWGMSSGDIATSLNNLGLLYGGGDPTNAQANDKANGSIYNRLNNEIYQGSQGYGVGQAAPGASSLTPITANAGHTFIDDGNGSGHWQQYGSTATPNAGGSSPPPTQTGTNQNMGFQTASQPMAGQITSMLNQGLQYGLGSGLQPSTTTTPLAGAQNAVSNILGTTTPTSSTAQTSAPSVGNVAATTAPATTPAATTSGPDNMAQGQATTQMQKFQSLVSSIPVGNPTPFGSGGQITRQQDGSIMVTGPSLSKPYMLDASMPQDQMMQQLQAIYSMVNAPPSGAPQAAV